MKNILVINGHPVKDSYGAALASAYVLGAKTTNHKVELINIREMDFNPNLMYGYKKRMTMEPDVEKAIRQIQNADHIVWVYPMWWYGAPALLKGFIDRTFLPEIAFRTREDKLPQKLLKGKSARIIITADTPRWYDYFFMKSPAINQLKKGTLGFSGIKPVKVSYISPIRSSSNKYRKSTLNKVKTLGEKGV